MKSSVDLCNASMLSTQDVKIGTHFGSVELWFRLRVTCADCDYIGGQVDVEEVNDEFVSRASAVATGPGASNGEHGDRLTSNSF